MSDSNIFVDDFRCFLSYARLNHLFGPLSHTDRPLMFETMKDICDCIEQTDVFQNIVRDCQIDYSKGLVVQLYGILTRVAPDVDSINYGRFWVILTYLRHVFMYPIIHNMDVGDYLYILDVLCDAVQFSLNEWVIREGGLESLCQRCQEKPATNFIFKFVNTLLEQLFNFVLTHA